MQGDTDSSAASIEVLTHEQLDKRISRLMQDLSARQPELTDALEDAVWLRYGIDL